MFKGKYNFNTTCENIRMYYKNFRFQNYKQEKERQNTNNCYNIFYIKYLNINIKY